MAAPPSDRPVVDFGAHLYPPGGLPDPVREDPLDASVGPVHDDPDLLAERFEAAGVDVAVLSQPYFMGHGDADATAAANDALLEVVEAYDAFAGLAAIPVAAGGEAAAEEFERSLEAGYHGGALETMTDGVELTDPSLEPVFDVAEAHGAPILVHPKLHASLGPDVLDDRWQLNATFGREVALCESICKVVHEGVVDRHPDLALVFHHLGGNVASMLGRIHLRIDAGRWPGQEHVLDFPAFKAGLDALYHDTSGYFGYAAPLRTTLEELPVERVLFGTDFPYEARTADELAAFVETVETVADEETAARVLGGNALDLLANWS